MKIETLNAFKEHALEKYPQEACGLVAVVKGREVYFPCTNAAENPRDHFRISGREYADVEDRGEITAIVHSHPDAPATPSQADLVSCEVYGVPWHIASVSRDDDGYVSVQDPITFQPSGYEAPLAGRVFSHGVLDCYSLIRDYYRTKRGIELPNYERGDDWWHKGEDLYEQYFQEAGFVQVSDEPQEGDVILMQIRAKVINHGAIYLGDGLMLHHMIDRLSSRDVYGGYWQEVTRKFVRHKELM